MKYEYSVNGKTYTLPEEEVQAFLKHYPNAELIREISDTPGKQTGVAGEAATVAPDEIAAATGLASGTSLSESPSLAAPLQTPIAQEINDPIKQTSLPSNFFLEEKARFLYNQKMGNINSTLKDYNKKTDDIRKGKITREQITDENYRRENYKSQAYDGAYNNYIKNKEKTDALPIAQKYKQETGSSLFAPIPNDADYASYAKTAVNNTLNNLPSNANLEDESTFIEAFDTSIQELHNNDKILQQDIIPGVIENIVMPKVAIEKKKLEEKYNLNSGNFNIEDLEKANKEINDFFIKTFNTEIGSNPDYAERFKKYNEAVSNELQKNLTEAGRKRLGLDEKTSLGETGEKTIKSISNSMRGSLIASLTETRLSNDRKIEGYEKMLESGEMTEDSFVTIGGSVSPKSGALIGGKKMKVKDAIIKLQKDNIRIKDENLGRLKNYFDIQGDLAFYKDAIQDIESSSSLTEFIGKVFVNTPNLVVEQLPQLALALSGVGVFAQELGPAYFDTIYAQMEKDGIEHSEENFIKYLEEGRGDFAIAAGSASTQQLLESIGGATIAGAIYKNIGKKQVMSLMKLGMKDWAKSGGYKALVAGGKKSALAEFLTEGFQTATNQIAKGLSIGESGKYIDTSEITKSAALGGYIGWILPFGGNIARQSANEISGVGARVSALSDKNTSLNILENIKSNIQLAAKQGKITQLESENKLKALIDVINADQKIRKEITGKDKVRALELQVEKQEIENEIESLDKDVDKSDLETRRGEIINEMNEIQKQTLGKLSTAGARNIAQAEGMGWKEFDSTKETESFIEEERAKGNKDIDITQSENYGFIIQNRKTGEQTIVLNKEEAKKDNVVTTAAHELLHGVLKNTFTSAEIQTKIGKELASEMKKMSLTGEVATDSNFANRWNAYHSRVLTKAVEGKEVTASDIGNAWEEGLNLLSEGLINGEIAYNETVFTKIGDMLRRALSQMGVKTKFNTGRDVFNFVRDYNKSLVKGKLTAGQQRVVAEGAGGALVNYAKSQEGVKEMGLRDTEVKTSASPEQILDQLRLLDRSAATRFKEMAIKEAEESGREFTVDDRGNVKFIEGGPLTGKAKETRIEEARKIVDNEVKSSLKIPEISKENKKIAAKNKELIATIKDEGSSVSEKQRAENELYNNNQGLFRDIINKNFDRKLDTVLEENDLISQLNETFSDAIRTWTPDKGAEFGAWFKILVNKKLPGAYKIVESKKDPETGKKVPIAKRQIEDFKTEGDVNIGGVTVQKDPDLENKTKLKKKLLTKKLGFDTEVIPGEFKINKDGKKAPKTFADVFIDAVAKTFGTKLPAVTNKNFVKAFSKNNIAELMPFVRSFTKIDRKKGIDKFKPFIIKNWKSILDQLPPSVINKKYDMLRKPVLKETGKQKREATAEGKGEFEYLGMDRKDFVDYFTNKNPDVIATAAGEITFKNDQGVESKLRITSKNGKAFIGKRLGDEITVDGQQVELTKIEVGSSTLSDRRTSLLETVINELSADAALEVVKDKTIMQKFKDIQEIEGQTVPENFLDEIVKKLDRGIDALNKIQNEGTLRASVGIVELATEFFKNVLKFLRAGIKAGQSFKTALNQAINKAAKEPNSKLRNNQEIQVAKNTIGTIKNENDLTPENIEKLTQELNAELFEQRVVQGLKTDTFPYIAGKLKDIKDPKLMEKVATNMLQVLSRGVSWSADHLKKSKNAKNYKDLIKLTNNKEVFKKLKEVLPKRYFGKDAINLKTKQGGGVGFYYGKNKIENIAYTSPSNVVNKGKKQFDEEVKRNKEARKIGFDFIKNLKNDIDNNIISIEAAENIIDISKNNQKGILRRMAMPNILFKYKTGTKYTVEHNFPMNDLIENTIKPYLKGKVKDIDLEFEIYNQRVNYVSEAFEKEIPSNLKSKKSKDRYKIPLNKFKNQYTEYNPAPEVDIKSSLKPKEITERVNEIIEDITGLDATKEVTIEEAIQWGKKNRKLQWWIPTAAEDLRGLVYRLVRKGKDGEKDLEFYDEVLFKPLNLAYTEYLTTKQKAMEDMSIVRKEISERGIDLQAEAFNGLTNDQVIRIYLWTKRGYDLTKLNSKDAVEQATINKVMNYIRELGQMDLIGVGGKLEKIYSEIDPETKETVSRYPKPPENWRAGGILYDLFDRYNGIERKEIFKPVFENIQALFGEFKNGKLTGKQANRLEAALGSHWVWVMEDMLTRLDNGRNRSYGNDKQLNNALDWTNAAVATTMFVNSRSVTLQLISNLNFINLEDNNVLAVGKAYMSKDFIPTFMEIFNSDYLKQRRAGLKIDVNLDELSRAAEGQVGASKFNAIVSALLKKGFYPTQIADSTAIAWGGAPFLINRTNKYIKDGMSKKAAREQAFQDFMEISENTQQASRPDKISMQQASSVGKLVLAFQNYPMQAARIQKRAFQDLFAGRGNPVRNVGLILHYGVVQNVIFHAMQKAIFAIAFQDEAKDEDEEKRLIMAANGVVDTLLAGGGYYGMIAAMGKNVLLELIEEFSEGGGKDTREAVVRATSFSPPINAKFRNLNQAARRWERKDNREAWDELNIDNPILRSSGELIEVTMNVPANRLINKLENIMDATSKDTEWWRKVFLMMGWSSWDLYMEDYQQKAPLKLKGMKTPRKVKTRTIKKRKIG